MPSSADTNTLAHKGVTISEVLARKHRITLYGARISDLTPRGDLGLALDPEGPVCFAHIRGYRSNGSFKRLRRPLVLSVYGHGRPGEPSDIDALPGEQVWDATWTDPVLQLELREESLSSVLGDC
jgi:hypothetical protein